MTIEYKIKNNIKNFFYFRKIVYISRKIYTKVKNR
jgi:hypothetical protein